jgi:DNA-binding response OmpR family regulator
VSTILVVEDDLDIARLVSHNLTAAGHVVVDVHDFDAAEELLLNWPRYPKLVRKHLPSAELKALNMRWLFPRQAQRRRAG